MSVAESKSKGAGKTTRKAKNAANVVSDTVLSAVLAQTAEQHVPLSALVKSPMNVRIVPYSAESVRELADSIKGIGLLQNLVVHALPDGLYGVAAGGRRLAAMNLLVTESTITPDWPVRVKVVPEDLATAASLTENGQHLEMHAAEQIAGFRAMAAEGKTPAQTGDLLGYSPRHVQRMLKLAGLAPVNSMDGELTNNEQTASGGVVLATLNKKPFTVVLETERGLNLSIQAVPRPGAGRTVQLVSDLRGTGEEAGAWETATPYESLLVSVSQAVRGGTLPAGWYQVPVTKETLRVFARKGEVMNPLQYVPFNQTLYFINGDDPEQVAWMKRQTPPTLESKIILLRGSIPQAQTALDSRIYFDQNGVLCQRLGIDQVPARVTAVPGDRLLKVEFIPVGDKK